MLGSAAVDLTWLAEGKIDASVTLSNRSWDMAAGVIVAREAGAVVVDLDGREHTTRLGHHDRNQSRAAGRTARPAERRLTSRRTWALSAATRGPTAA